MWCPAGALVDGGRARRGGLCQQGGFCFISMIRLPEFVTPGVLEWAKAQAAATKGAGHREGGVFEPRRRGSAASACTLAPLTTGPPPWRGWRPTRRNTAAAPTTAKTRRHHEIYLSDPRKCAPEKLRTVLQAPVAPLKEKNTGQERPAGHMTSEKTKRGTENEV